MENKAYYKLGLNISGFREFYGLTQTELAEKINVTKQAISQYELGVNVPQRDILLRICRCFQITENELINGNYENMETITGAPVHDKDFQTEMLNRLLPCISSDLAMEDKCFYEAYVLHQGLYKSFIDGINFDEALIDKCLDLYEKSFRNGVIEGVANYLWWIMFFAAIKSISSPQLIENAKKLEKNRISFKEFLRDGMLNSSDTDFKSEEDKEFLKSRINFVKENELEIFTKIRLLKMSKEYSDLGDYYLAFIYLFNLIQNNKSTELNCAIGYELMNTYSILGNQYTQKFRAIYNDF